VTAGGNALVRLEPRGLQLAIHDMNQPPLRLESGEIAIAETIALNRLRGRWDEGEITVDGTLDPASLAADLQPAWTNLPLGGAAATGEAQLNADRTLAGVLESTLSMRTRVDAAGGSGELAAELRAVGDSPHDLHLSLRTEPLTWHRAGGDTGERLPAQIPP